MSTLSNNLQINTIQGQTTIGLTIKGNFLYAQVFLSQRIIEISSEQIKCSLGGSVPHLDFIQRVDQIARNRLFACTFPSDSEPTEILIFEATDLAAPVMNQARDRLKQGDFEQGIKELETAVKLQELHEGDVKELRRTIVHLKKELFLRRIKKNADLFLSPEELDQFNKIIQLYQNLENPFYCWSQYLEVQYREQKGFIHPHLSYLAACLNEHDGKAFEAAPKYLYLALKHPNPIHCLKKVAEIIRETKDSLAFPHFLERIDRDWLIQLSERSRDPELKGWVLFKDALRMTFESYLAELSRFSVTTQAPTCFICFNVEEADVGKWLEQTLVPDLDRIGVRPLFCFRDLGPGKELNNFQGLIRYADKVIIVCTPDLKRKCDERKKAPTGVAQEIRIARERYNDPNKYETIFPLYMKGDRKDACPDEFFEPILGTNFTYLDKSTEVSVFSYYAQAFELLGGIRQIPRERCREIKQAFTDKANQILRGEIDQENLGQWKISRNTKVEAILKSAEQLVSQKIQMVNLPEAPKDFVGRTHEIEKLVEACLSKRCVAVTGLGGIGKTALALKYANDNRLHYQFIHFMPAGTPQLIIDGLLKLAEDLYIPKTDEIEKRLSWLKIALERFEQNFLLILDGIDQIEAFEKAAQYLPQRGQCLLLTTRMPQQSAIRGFDLIELNPFVLEDAICYLLQTCGSKEEALAKELAEKLGRLPLALTHAARYIQSQKISIQKYLKLFNQYELKLFETEYLDLTKEEKTILTTWKISIDVIETNHKCGFAKDILEMFAFLGQAPIPLELIEKCFEKFHDELELGKALRHLCGYSMISSSGINMYSVHPLVQKVTLNQIATEKKQKVFGYLLSAVTNLMLNFHEEDTKSWALPKLCLPHAINLLEKESLIAAQEPIQQQWFLEILSKVNQNFGIPTLTLRVSKKSIEIAEKCEKENPCPETQTALANSLNIYGKALEAVGKYETALETHLQALEIRKKLYREPHLDVAASLNNVGVIFGRLKNFQKAIENFQEALTIRQAHCGTESLEVAASFNNLGAIYGDSGENQKALEYHQKALDIRIKLYGYSHPQVAFSLNNMSVVLRRLGKAQESLECCEKACKIRESVYGESHPSVANCLDNIGIALETLGRKQEALPKHELALSIKQKWLGEFHLDVATSLENVGIVLNSLGERGKALEYHQRAYKIRQASLGDSHIIVARSLESIGEVLSDLGDNKEALKNHELAYKIKIKHYGPSNIYIANSLRYIGITLDRLGMKVEALEKYKAACEIRRNTFNKAHPDIAKDLKDMGMIYEELQQKDQAIACFQEACGILLQLYRADHPEIETIQDAIRRLK